MNEQATTTEQEQAVPVHPFGFDKERYQKSLVTSILKTLKNVKLIRDSEHDCYYCLFCNGKPTTHAFAFEHDGGCTTILAHYVEF